MRALAISVLSAFALSGCVSSYDNPYYQHASNAPADAAAGTATTTSASYQPDAVFVPAPAPVSAPIAQPVQEIEMAGAPTDTLYADRSVSGTPGYMAVQGEARDGSDVSVQQPTIESVTAGTRVDYDMSRNFVQADTAMVEPSLPDTVTMSANLGQSYVVQPGDTVYSLSRQSCVGVTVIQSMNGLDANFGIDIGQTLRLPASKC